MDIERNIAYLRADADKANAVVTAICDRLGVGEAEFAAAKAARQKAERGNAPRPRQFNIGQFSSAGATAIMAANAERKFLPDFDAQADDGTSDESEHSNLGMAADLINCEISGESGPGCGHHNCDHVARAIDYLQNYSKDQAMRDKHRDEAGRMSVGVRFA